MQVTRKDKLEVLLQKWYPLRYDTNIILYTNHVNTDYDYPFPTIEAGTAYPSGAPVLTRFLVVFVLLDL
jgi:hypothetical protein